MQIQLRKNREFSEDESYLKLHDWVNGKPLTKVNTDENFLKDICKLVKRNIEKDYKKKVLVDYELKSNGCDIIVEYDTVGNYSTDKLLIDLGYKFKIVFTDFIFEEGKQYDYITSLKNYLTTFSSGIEKSTKEGNSELSFKFVWRDKDTILISIDKLSLYN